MSHDLIVTLAALGVVGQALAAAVLLIVGVSHSMFRVNLNPSNRLAGAVRPRRTQRDVA